MKSGYGSAAALTATVSPQYSGTPSGSVTLYDGSAQLTTVGLSSGKATYTTAQLSGAPHSFHAVYLGDTNFTTSTCSTVSLKVPVTSVSFQLAATKLVYPLPPAFAVKIPVVGKNAPAGTIIIYDGTAAIASYPLLAAFQGNLLGLVLPPLNVGTHPLMAVYSGDANYAPGQSAIVTVTVTPGPVQLSVKCSSTRLTLGQTLNCTVSAYEEILPVTGKVTYTSTGGTSGSATLNNLGTGAISYQPNNKGSYSLTTNYAAQGNYQAAPPVSVSYTVN